MQVIECLRLLPTLDEVRLAILANNGGGYERRDELCQCDHSCGLMPCQYCAIEHVLSRVLKIVEGVRK
jgi:hypothetical protein